MVGLRKNIRSGLKQKFLQFTPLALLSIQVWDGQPISIWKWIGRRIGQRKKRLAIFSGQTFRISILTRRISRRLWNKVAVGLFVFFAVRMDLPRHFTGVLIF